MSSYCEIPAADADLCCPIGKPGDHIAFIAWHCKLYPYLLVLGYKSVHRNHEVTLSYQINGDNIPPWARILKHFEMRAELKVWVQGFQLILRIFSIYIYVNVQ